MRSGKDQRTVVVKALVQKLAPDREFLISESKCKVSLFSSNDTPRAMVLNPNLLIPIPAVPKHLLSHQNSSNLSPGLSPQQPHPSPFPWTTVAPDSQKGYIHDSGIGSDFSRSPPSGSRTPSGFEFLDWSTREGGLERGRSL